MAPVHVDLPVRRIAAGTGGGLVGRGELLDSIDRLLDQGGTELALTAADSALSLHGAGGIGKTALALEYCYTIASQREYELVWWVSAETDATTASSFSSLVERLGGDTQDPNIRHQVDLALEAAGRWLVVFDNVDDIDAFERWRPQAHGGSILITTRSNAGWAEDRSLAVDLIEDTDAKNWLLKAANNPFNEEEVRAAAEIVEELGGLALALTMAAAFIHNTPVSLSTYLRLYKQDAAKLLDDPAVDVGGYDKTVHAALSVAREQLRTSNQDAALLMLEYVSFFAADDVPMMLFTPDGLDVESEADVLRARRALAERSLITPQGEDAFSVHRLIQSVTRYNLEHPPAESHQIEAGEAAERTIPTTAPTRNTQAHKLPSKVVVFAANSTNAPLNLGEELRNIQESLEFTTELSAEISHAPRPDDLVKYVSDHRPLVVHFSGHGNSDGIALKDDDGTSSRLVNGERLRRFFESRGVELVVLNSCYSKEQAEAIFSSVRAVIATPASLDDKAAIRFSKAFYRTLARGRTVADALKDGQDAVGLYEIDDEFVPYGNLDFALTGGKTQSTSSGQPAVARPHPARPATATNTPVAGRKNSRLERAYWIAGIAVAVTGIAALIISLLPDNEEPAPDPTSPTIVTTAPSDE